MKNIIAYLLIVLTGYGFATIGPWWIPVVPCFVICAWLVGANGWSAWGGFLVGGLALLTLWLGTTWMIDARDPTGLADKIGQLFRAGVPGLESFSGKLLVYLVTGIVSFLLGGLAGMSGVMIRR